MDALWAVASRAGTVVRLLADTNVPNDRAVRAARDIEPELARAAAALPGAAAAEAMADYSNAANPVNGAAPDRHRLLTTLSAVCAFVMFYGDVSSGATAVATDGVAVVQWAVEHAQVLPDWFRDVVLP